MSSFSIQCRLCLRHLLRLRCLRLRLRRRLGVTARNYPVGMASLSPSPSLPLVPTDVVVLVTRTAPRITEASSARATSRGILV